MKADHIILGVHITNRVQKAAEVQKAFTEFGCNIKTRLGLHEATENVCSAEGIVLLEIVGGEAIAQAMIQKLSAIDGVEAKAMTFSHA